MLVRHMDVLTGRRDLRCPRSGCDYATSHRSNLRRHEYTHLRQCMHGVQFICTNFRICQQTMNLFFSV